MYQIPVQHKAPAPGAHGGVEHTCDRHCPPGSLHPPHEHDIEYVFTAWGEPIRLDCIECGHAWAVTPL